MVTKHLTDDEVQQYAVDKPNCEKRIDAHIHLCDECKSKVEVYQLLITGIMQQPQPVFDFDLSSAVLKQLPVSSPGLAIDNLLTGIFIFLCSGLIATTVYFFRGYLYSMFKGVAGISIYLISISAITVIAILFVEMYKKYQKEMRALDLY